LEGITISVVSHNQDLILNQLMNKLANYSVNISKVIITHNTVEKINSFEKKYPFEVVRIQNEKPKGFGTNHNKAFKHCETDMFCVINPDIDLISEPFEDLRSCFNDSSIAIVAPLIKNLKGKVEDTARYFPTPFGIFKKLFFNYTGIFHSDDNNGRCYPDWVGGMFLLFKSKIYRELGGFDERYFLYYEDVDICIRSWKFGYKVLQYKRVSVIHDARRTSHSNLRYLKWHVASLIRFFASHFGRFPTKIY
jgi:N-acetylglucosaminyl-diphospho-decaprenol L-rhamnosyltransferase